MKKLIWTLAILGVVFMGCKDDDEETGWLDPARRIGDTYEANNNTAEAFPLTGSSNIIFPFIYPQGDEDWFKICPRAGQSVAIVLDDLPADYDLYFYDSFGNLLAYSTNLGNSRESIGYSNLEGNWYYIQVIGHNNSFSESSYCLGVGVE